MPVWTYYRYDIAQYLADRYKMLAKLLFVVQLLVSWAIVVNSTLYASWYACLVAEDCNDDDDWWIVSDSNVITMLGQVVFFLTVCASFLISFDSYVNAKARTRPLTRATLVLFLVLVILARPNTYAISAGCRGAGGSCGRVQAH